MANLAGGATGALSGAATGATLGSVVPGIGTGIGAIGGGIIGGLGGLFGGGTADAPNFGALNDKQTQANRPDQFTPFGFSQWSQDPAGKWTQHQGLSGPMQGLMDQGIGALGNIGSVRDRAESSLYNRQTRMMDPQWAQRETATKAGAINSGQMPGDPGYNAEMGLFGDSRNRAYADARDSSIAGGGQEAMLQEHLALDPFESMMGASRSFQMPTFNQDQSLTAGIAQGNFDQGNANMNNQLMGSMFGGLGQLGAAAIRSKGMPFGLGGGGANYGGDVPGGT